ncbi:hypothetical protein [Intrasporangium sp. DVR]|uniref:hypothetical protein n=1 Tax=Intrasporangium sp. DVR TaxID=3127867 RepID=UPI00313A676B
MAGDDVNAERHDGGQRQTQRHDDGRERGDGGEQGADRHGEQADPDDGDDSAERDPGREDGGSHGDDEHRDCEDESDSRHADQADQPDGDEQGDQGRGRRQGATEGVRARCVQPEDLEGKATGSELSHWSIEPCTACQLAVGDPSTAPLIPCLVRLARQG